MDGGSLSQCVKFVGVIFKKLEWSGGSVWKSSKLSQNGRPPSQVINDQPLRKLSNFNFSRQTHCTRIIISIILHSFLHFLRAIKCNKLDEITPKKRFLSEPGETNFKNFKVHKMNLCITILPVFSQFLWNLKVIRGDKWSLWAC